ncbi:MAG: hypothetical protein Q8Q39_04440 [bacterium]|nr:hypothetical protein [bacterium]
MEKTGLWSSDEVWRRLAEHGYQGYALKDLIELYRKDRELLFQLAVIGVGTHAPFWAKDAAALARKLGQMVRNTAFIKQSSGHYGVLHAEGAELWGGVGMNQYQVITFSPDDIPLVREFLDNFSPIGAKQRNAMEGRSMLEGIVISHAEMAFAYLNLEEFKGMETEARVETERTARSVVTEVNLTDLVAADGIPFLTALASQRPDHPNQPESVYARISTRKDKCERAFHEASLDIRKNTFDESEKRLHRIFSPHELDIIRPRLSEICLAIRTAHVKNLGALASRFPSLQEGL